MDLPATPELLLETVCQSVADTIGVRLNVFLGQDEWAIFDPAPGSFEYSRVVLATDRFRHLASLHELLRTQLGPEARVSIPSSGLKRRLDDLPSLVKRTRLEKSGFVESLPNVTMDESTGQPRSPYSTKNDAVSITIKLTEFADSVELPSVVVNDESTPIADVTESASPGQPRESALPVDTPVLSAQEEPFESAAVGLDESIAAALDEMVAAAPNESALPAQPPEPVAAALDEPFAQDEPFEPAAVAALDESAVPVVPDEPVGPSLIATNDSPYFAPPHQAAAAESFESLGTFAERSQQLEPVEEVSSSPALSRSPGLVLSDAPAVVVVSVPSDESSFVRPQAVAKKPPKSSKPSKKDVSSCVKCWCEPAAFGNRPYIKGSIDGPVCSVRCAVNNCLDRLVPTSGLTLADYFQDHTNMVILPFENGIKKVKLDKHLESRRLERDCAQRIVDAYAQWRETLNPVTYMMTHDGEQFLAQKLAPLLDKLDSARRSGKRKHDKSRVSTVVVSPVEQLHVSPRSPVDAMEVVGDVSVYTTESDVAPASAVFGMPAAPLVEEPLPPPPIEEPLPPPAVEEPLPPPPVEEPLPPPPAVEEPQSPPPGVPRSPVGDAMPFDYQSSSSAGGWPVRSVYSFNAESFSENSYDVRVVNQASMQGHRSNFVLGNSSSGQQSMSYNPPTSPATADLCRQPDNFDVSVARVTGQCDIDIDSLRLRYGECSSTSLTYFDGDDFDLPKTPENASSDWNEEDYGYYGGTSLATPKTPGSPMFVKTPSPFTTPCSPVRPTASGPVLTFEERLPALIPTISSIHQNMPPRLSSFVRSSSERPVIARELTAS